MKSSALAAGEFKASCGSLMGDVAATGGEIVITKPGRPVAKLVPHRLRHKAQSLLGALAYIGESSPPPRCNYWPP